MSIKDKFEQASSKVDAYKSTINTAVNEEKLQKLSDGLDSNFQKAKSETLKQLNAMGDIKQRAQQEFQNTFDELTNLLKKSMPSGDKFKNTGSCINGDTLHPSCLFVLIIVYMKAEHWQEINGVFNLVNLTSFSAWSCLTISTKDISEIFSGE